MRDMLAAADALGGFQVESRAQMNFLPRVRPCSMADLTVEVTIIRPGPLHGGMAKAYLARHHAEPVAYWHPALEAVLAGTLGVLVFQEQVLRLAMAVAGFSGAHADGLRRSMGCRRSEAAMERWQADCVAGATARGLGPAEADGILDKRLGFASYGFCKSHAASFARLTLVRPRSSPTYSWAS